MNLTSMTRQDAATIFERIATLLELKGENPFKTRAYRAGAEIVESFSGDIMKMAAENQLGIADHSKSSFQANGLDEKRLLAQLDEIRQLNTEYDGHFRIFAGSEVDILKDGSLDFPDEILAQLDYAVASVHNVFNLPEADMTRRILRAIENPHITMIGHLTGRLLLQRPGYAVDVPAILDAAAETGTIIELNASAWRLDLDWRWWKLAKEKGVKCSINPDAHSIHGLKDVIFGIRTARKGWLRREDIINCLPLAEVEQALRAKQPSPHV